MDSEFPDEGDAEAEALAEAAALQLPAKLESKKWKIRGLGYSEVEAIFDDPNTPDDELQRLLPDISTYVAEKHAGAKDSALAAATACVRRCASREPDQTFEKLAAELTQSLSGKPAARDAALEVLMLLTEAGRTVGPPALLSACKNGKAPKVISESVAGFRQLVHVFGTTVVDPRPMASQLVLLFDHRNEPVRKEALKVCIELYRWLGEPFRTSLEQLKDVGVNHDKHKAMLNKLAPYFEKADNAEPLSASRFVQGKEHSTPQKFSCGDLKIASTAVRLKKASVVPENGDSEAVPGQPFDLIASLPSTWHTDAIAKKWSERKTALDLLIGLLEPVDMLDPDGNYLTLVQVLSNMITTDSNVRVVALALQALGLLCKSLGAGFAPHSKLVLKDVMQKLGDAKISESAVSCMNEMAAQRSIPTALAIQQVEVVLSSSSSPNKMKKSCLVWLTQFMNPDLKESLVSRLVKLLTKATKSTASDVRDAGVDALKALVVAVGQQSPPVAQCLAALGKHIVAKVLGAGGKLEPANELLNTAPVKGSKTQSRATKKTPPAVKTATEDLLKTAPIKNSTNSEPRPDRPPKVLDSNVELERASSLPNVASKPQITRRKSLDCSVSATSRRATPRQVELATNEIEFACDGAEEWGTMDLAQHMQCASDAPDREFVMRGKHAYGRGLDMNEQAFLLQELETLRKLASQASAKLAAKEHASVPASDKSNRTVLNCSQARTSPLGEEPSPAEQSFGFRDRASETASRSSGSREQPASRASDGSDSKSLSKTNSDDTLGISPTEPRALRMDSNEGISPTVQAASTAKPLQTKSAAASQNELAAEIEVNDGASTEKPWQKKSAASKDVAPAGVEMNEEPIQAASKDKPWQKNSAAASKNAAPAGIEVNDGASTEKPWQKKSAASKDAAPAAERSGGVLGVLSAMQNSAPHAKAAPSDGAADLEAARKQLKARQDLELSLNIDGSADGSKLDAAEDIEGKSDLQSSPSFKAAQKPGLSALRMLKKGRKGKPQRRLSAASTQPMAETVGPPDGADAERSTSAGRRNGAGVAFEV